MPAFDVEINGPNTIQESERSGTARSLFWPWAGANVSLLALSYGAFFLGFGISFWQATFAAIWFKTGYPFASNHVSKPTKKDLHEPESINGLVLATKRILE